MAIPPPLQVPQALQMGVLPTFGGLPYTAQPIGLMPVPAPPATGQSTATTQVPMAPQPSTASSSTSNFSVPVRGRDVPHRQSRARSQAPGAWHQDRAGNTWQDHRQQSPQDRAGSTWQDYRQQSPDRSWHWHSNWWQGWRDWHSNDRQGWDNHQSPPRGSRAQPNWHDPTESAPHVDVQRDGWQWSYQLDEALCTAVADDRTIKVGSPANSYAQFNAQQRTAIICVLHAIFRSEILRMTTTVVISAVTADRSSSGARHGTKPG